MSRVLSGPRSFALSIVCLAMMHGAHANVELAERQARASCEAYANTLLGLADSWRFKNDGHMFDLRQQTRGEEIGVEMFLGTFEAVSHPGLKRFLEDTLKYLWDDEARARRFINSGRFMSECLPANMEVMQKQLNPSSQAAVRQRLRDIQTGALQGRAVEPVPGYERPRQSESRPNYDHRPNSAAAPQRQDHNRNQRASQNPQGSQRSSPGLSDRR